jgi:hypothetical protein
MPGILCSNGTLWSDFTLFTTELVLAQRAASVAIMGIFFAACCAAPKQYP